MSVARRRPTVEDYITPLPELSEHKKKNAIESKKDTIEYDDGLLAVAGPIMVLCYVLLFAVAGITFFANGSALFAVAVSAVFGVVFFAVPLVFLKMRAKRDVRWIKDAPHTTCTAVETCTGEMSRSEAIIQIVSIPVAIVVGFTLLAIRWSLL